MAPNPRRSGLRSEIYRAKLPVVTNVDGFYSWRRGRGSKALRNFLSEKLDDYLRNEISQKKMPRATFRLICISGIFPHIKFSRNSEAARNGRTRKSLLRANGSRSGWWDVRASAEGFLDQFITWRELGFQFLEPPGRMRVQSLPEWARNTLARHAKDERAYVYSLNNFAERKRTIHFGMRHNANLSAKAACTIICEWSGGRKYWSGRERRRRRWRR